MKETLGGKKYGRNLGRKKNMKETLGGEKYGRNLGRRKREKIFAHLNFPKLLLTQEDMLKPTAVLL